MRVAPWLRHIQSLSLHSRSLSLLARPIFMTSKTRLSQSVSKLSSLLCFTSDWHLHQKRHTVCTESLAVRSSCVPNWVARSLVSPCLRRHLPRGDIVGESDGESNVIMYHIISCVTLFRLKRSRDVE